MGRVIYTLTDSEAAMLDSLAVRRNEQKRQFLRERGKNYDAKASDIQTHRLGIGAEYAVARTLGGQWDDRILRAGNKRGWDVQCALGTIDVKFRRKHGYAYTLDSVRPVEFRADLGVLVWPDKDEDLSGRHYWIVGFVWRAEFQAHAAATLVLPWPLGEGLTPDPDKVQVENWGYGDRLVMRAGWMTPFENLIAQVAASKQQIRRVA